MCKVLIVSSMKNVKDLKALVNVASKEITKDDNDGFGWCAQGSSGVFGEKSIAESTHKYRLDRNHLSVKIPVVSKTYEAFGEKSDTLLGAGLFHGRTSTNSVSLVNTHPIQKHGWSLIHNGVVSWHGKKYRTITTNDTEHLAEALGTKGISSIEKDITGYYAIGAIDPDGRLHVVKDSTAWLHVAFVETIDAYVFGTTPALIESVAKGVGWSIGPIESVLDNSHLIFDQEGTLIHNEAFKPRGYSKKESSLASKSLHYMDASTTGSSGDYLEEYERDAFIFENDDELNYESFFHEVQRMDATYRVWDENDLELSIDQFRRLDSYSQLMCTVQRPDGTVLSPDDELMVSGY